MRPSSAAEQVLKTITVAVLAFDGISPFHLSVPCLVFGEDRQELGVLPFRLLVCAPETRPLPTQAGFTITPQHGLDALTQADIVIVPTWRDPQEQAPPAVLAALRAAHARGATVVGLCLGAFVLAEAGLLDGRVATTHWYLADCFARRFPQVRLDPDVLYVDEGKILTSAGTAASLDCCLYLLRRLCGAEVANRVARRLVVAPHRQGGQAQFIEQPLPANRRDDRLAEVLAWVQAHLQAPHSVETLAARAAMSRRTFTRRFKDATGSTLLPWLLHQRLSHAQRLLEQNRDSIEQVALAAGFGSAVSLRQHFGTAFGIAPAAYRRQFQLQQG